jgi:hypothetical protein
VKRAWVRFQSSNGQGGTYQAIDSSGYDVSLHLVGRLVFQGYVALQDAHDLESKFVCCMSLRDLQVKHDVVHLVGFLGC